jgi:hypothetical protein
MVDDPSHVRLPPPDDGLSTSDKVARWMADELGLEKLALQRGWEALTRVLRGHVYGFPTRS